MKQYTENINDVIRMLYSVADTLRYAMEIISLNDCNTCNREECSYKPKPGQMVRINCPHWIEKEHDAERN